MCQSDKILDNYTDLGDLTDLKVNTNVRWPGTANVANKKRMKKKRNHNGSN